MLETLIRAVVRSKVGDMRRRTRGVLIEGAALGMAGVAVVFLFAGAYFWLASKLEAWVAAFILGGVALVAALILLLVGRSMLKPRPRGEDDQMLAGLEALGLLSRKPSGEADPLADTEDGGVGLVAAALLAGVLMGRSLGR